MYSREEKWSFSVSSFPLSKIKYWFCILLPKSFKTVDPSERSKETSPVISYKIISQGYQANFPLQNSSSSTQTSSPTPVFPQYPEELGGGGGKSQAGLLLHLAELWKRRQKSQGQMQGKEGLSSGQLCRAPTCCSNPSRFPEPPVHEPFAEPGRGRQQWLGEGWSPRETYCLARLLSALSSWLSQRIGGNFRN